MVEQKSNEKIGFDEVHPFWGKVLSEQRLNDAVFWHNDTRMKEEEAIAL